MNNIEAVKVLREKAKKFLSIARYLNDATWGQSQEMCLSAADLDVALLDTENIEQDEPVGIAKRFNVGGSGEFVDVFWTGKVKIEDGMKLYATLQPAPQPAWGKSSIDSDAYRHEQEAKNLRIGSLLDAAQPAVSELTDEAIIEIKKASKPFDGKWGESLSFARDLLQSIAPQPTKADVVVPDGWKLVPIEATETMLAISRKISVDTIYNDGEYFYVNGGDIYRAMIAAAPSTDKPL